MWCTTPKRCYSISQFRNHVRICEIAGEQNDFIQIRLFSWDPSTNLILCNSPNAKSSLFGPTCYVSIYTFCINIRRYFQIYKHEWYNHGVVVSIQKCYLTSAEIPNMNDRLIFIMETPYTWKNGFIFKWAWCHTTGLFLSFMFDSEFFWKKAWNICYYRATLPQSP